jgi:hypothetical protein
VIEAGEATGEEPSVCGCRAGGHLPERHPVGADQPGEHEEVEEVDVARLWEALAVFEDRDR